MSAENKNSRARILIGGALVLIVAAAGLIYMIMNQRSALSNESNKLLKDQQSGPMVKVLKAGISDGKGLALIGEARPYQSVTLYAKTSGYMNKIFVDKGDKVKQGQLLATIVSPEIDQAYNAAIADLNNKKKILERDKALVQKEYISKEDEELSETNVNMSAAQVQSLKAQMDYKNIIAPFPGTVTARFADPGALVQNATSSQTSAQPIVTLSELDRIRIYVYVAQNDAAFLQENYPVTITMTERPDMKISATVTRIAGELDPKTRMMLVEIDLPNANDNIIPGSYLQVTFRAPEVKNLTIPTEALVIRGGQYFVPVITADSTLHYQPVTIGTNDGVHATILSGIQTGDIVGVNVSPQLTEGQKVRIQL